MSLGGAQNVSARESVATSTIDAQSAIRVGPMKRYGDEPTDRIVARETARTGQE
jgi:PIN domain nuclease of toxin-antitoxin system